MSAKDEAATILIVDDVPANLGVMVESLEQHGYRVAVAQDGEEGLLRATRFQPDLILLDVMMPGLNGFEVCRRLKASPATKDIPVIFMTALSDTADKLGGFQAGGVDYVTKPFQIDEVLARIGTHLSLRTMQQRLRRQNAELEDYRANLERQVAERTAELRESNERLSLKGFALNAVHEAAYLMDYETRFVYVNQEACRALGYSAEELLSMKVEDIDPVWTAEQGRENWAKGAVDGRLKFETRHHRKDGTSFPVEISSSEFEYRGRPYFLALARDVTERKEAERKLHASEQMFRALVENTTDIIVRLDRDCRRIYVNPALQRIFGSDTAAILNRTPGEALISPFASEVNRASGAKALEHTRQVLASGKATEADYTWIAPDGRTLHFVTNYAPEFDPDGKVCSVVAISHDITERKIAEDRLKESEQRLQESNAMLRELSTRRESAREEERKRIAREIHDELGQHLTALRMGISTLRFQFGQDNPLLSDRVQKMMALADKTIQVVRDVAATLRPPVLDSGLGPALQWLAAEFQRHTDIPCEVHVPETKLDLGEDRAMAFFRIVQESLTNVARHAKATSVRIEFCSEGDNAVVRVIDDGQGFSPTAGKRKSFGLVGMRERALMLDGEIEVDSTPGEGTTVTARIPIQATGEAS